MTSIVTPLAQLAPAFEISQYQKRLRPNVMVEDSHTLVNTIFTDGPAPSADIAALAEDPAQLYAYITGIIRVLPWCAATAFSTPWEVEATANGITLATRIIRAITPLPEPIFFHMMAVLYRPAEEGGVDFSSAASTQQTAKDLDGDWFNTISAFVPDLIRYRGLGQDGRTHEAGARLYALGTASLRARYPRKKSFSDQAVTAEVHALLLGEQALVSNQTMRSGATAT